LATFFDSEELHITFPLVLNVPMKLLGI